MNRDAQPAPVQSITAPGGWLDLEQVDHDLAAQVG